MPQVFPCPRPTNCYNSQDDLEVQCSKGYNGWLCSRCEENYYSVLNYCLPCPKSAWLYTELAATGVFCVILYAFIFRRYKKQNGGNAATRLLVTTIISRGKIILGFYQVVGEFFSSVHGVHWTEALKLIGNLVSFVELNILRIIFKPKCLNEKLQLNPKIEFLIGIAFPCILILSSFVLYWIMRVRYKLKCMFKRASEPVDVYTTTLKSKLLTGVVVLLFVTFPPICTTIFQLYPRACQKFCLDRKNTNCMTLLRSDYDIHCKDLAAYHVSAYIATVLYVIGFPLVLFLILRKQTQRRPSGPLYAINETGTDLQNLMDDSHASKTNPVWVDFLCENYKPQFWYWEIIELTRKVTQTVLVTLLGWEHKLTVLVTIGISVLYLTLHARCMPMKSVFEQRLQMVSLIAVLTNVLVVAMDVPEEYGDEVSVAIIVLNVLVIVIIAGREILLTFFLSCSMITLLAK
ncbi:hypothetical protein HOLleu_02176 [Holothuria leucospilota]|uniref:Uncharacterized protein n=1 Tax=Holothuria leucospilota TaxID=206669 RepID=A0A9Q1CRE2_HOLLE|nr:hypothetical protein HOLleu_02176 [Holothuria leucospilota]